ncbi:MAG: triosephosphate isomerase [Cenarchaeum symbiont of Oopsacas minuta]|nr:triosephosphate isomerase [Cenarchaeum symbiont of Oopsacas minuta]
MLLVINCKNYTEVSSPKKLLQLADSALKRSKRYKVKIAIAPPPHMCAWLALSSKIMVLAQHVDIQNTGSTTGYTIPEMLPRSNIAGSIINHSEHRIPVSHIRDLVSRLSKLRLLSIVCAKNITESGKLAKFDPNFVAVEPPQLIGSGKSVSKHRPKTVSGSAEAVALAKNKTKLLCGAGIVTAQDVASAINLGSSGILVASGIVCAKNWEKVLDDFASQM